MGIKWCVMLKGHRREIILLFKDILHSPRSPGLNFTISNDNPSFNSHRLSSAKSCMAEVCSLGASCFSCGNISFMPQVLAIVSRIGYFIMFSRQWPLDKYIQLYCLCRNVQPNLYLFMIKWVRRQTIILCAWMMKYHPVVCRCKLVYLHVGVISPIECNTLKWYRRILFW